MDELIRKERESKLVKQQQYKEILDRQMKMNKDHKMYGNMTQVEKKLNNYDLYAYKHNDNNMYSLVPGFNTYKKEPEDSMIRTNVSKFDPMERLKKVGFTRDVRDLPNYAGTIRRPSSYQEQRNSGRNQGLMMHEYNTNSLNGQSNKGRLPAVNDNMRQTNGSALQNLPVKASTVKQDVSHKFESAMRPRAAGMPTSNSGNLRSYKAAMNEYGAVGKSRLPPTTSQSHYRNSTNHLLL